MIFHSYYYLSILFIKYSVLGVKEMKNKQRFHIQFTKNLIIHFGSKGKNVLVIQ